MAGSEKKQLFLQAITRIAFVCNRNKEIFLQPSLIIRQLISMYMKMDTRLLIKTNTQSSVLMKCSIKEGA